MLKRTLDLVVAGGALAATWPVMASVALLIRATMGKPVIFRQVRPGYKECLFVAYKFRTMREAKEGEDDRPISDKERLTSIGRFIRRASLDELPQLFNVLRGDMSLVGPRPLLVQYIPRYNADQRRRHDARPGITGWAQINGRNATTWDERFAHDLWYVDNWSLLLDLRILGLTVWKVLSGDGISQPGQETMQEFMGNPDSTCGAASG